MRRSCICGFDAGIRGAHVGGRRRFAGLQPWNATPHGTFAKTIYVKTSKRDGDRLIDKKLHREVMNAPAQVRVDHISGTGLITGAKIFGCVHTHKIPLAIDLFCGLGGWTEGLLAEGYDVVGFDIEQHVYGEHRYPAQLVVQDVLTLHGSQFRDAALIVASPPCQEYTATWRRCRGSGRRRCRRPTTRCSRPASASSARLARRQAGISR
jgi:hypothetical protein